MKRTVMIAIALVLAAVMVPAVYGASSVTETTSNVGRDTYCLALTWTAHTDGSVTDYETSSTIAGEILSVVTDPDTSAAGLTPSDNYDITLVDEYGIDVMGGALANRDSTTSEYALPLNGSNLYEPIVDGTLTLTVANNTKNAAKGHVYIYYRRY